MRRLVAVLVICGATWSCGGGGVSQGDIPGSDVQPGVDVAVDPGQEEGDPGGRPDLAGQDLPGTDQPGDPGSWDAGEDGATDEGEVVTPPCRPDTACDDGDPCTYGDVCDAEGVCRGTLAEGCDDGIECTEDACTDAETCTHEVKAGWCLVEDQCVEEGQGIDDLPCHSCISALAQDRLLPDDSLACDDGDGCTTGDHCANGTCVPGLAPDCDDGNPCTADSCRDGLCRHDPRDGETCDDGSLCTEGDRCMSDTCVGGPVACRDDNPCTEDRCDPAFGCLFDPNNAPCDDGNLCTVGDQCRQGGCVPGDQDLACDDDNPCTDDGCVPSRGCVFVPNAAPCDDGDPCTLGDRCRAGACNAGTEALECDDGNLCTDDACQPGVGCVFVPNGDPCDDGNACTVGDVCSLGSCQPGVTPLSCDDGDPCSDDFCLPESGCGHAWNQAPCDDGNVCTGGDTCDGEGRCVGTPIVDLCDDGLQCTKDTCHPVNGCQHAVDNRPECRPQVVVDFPPRGATLDASSAGADGRTITVRGHVDTGLDGWFVTRLTVNDIPLIVNPVDRSFQVDIPSRQGMNPLVIDAEDVMGLKDHVVQSYYLSHQWYPVDQANPQQSQVPDGILLFLGPEVWDDNDTSDVDDIATILTLYIQSMDLNALIRNPVTTGSFGWCDYRVNVTNIRYGTPSVDLVPVNGGLRMHAVIPNFRADVSVPTSGFGCPDFDGTVTATAIVIDTTLLISLDPVTGQPVVTAQGTDVQIQGLNIDLSGVWGFLLNWLINFFEGTFADQIEAAFRDQITSLIPALQEALAGLAINTDFEVPAFFPGGSPVTLGLRSRFSSIQFTPDGGLLGLAATVVAPHGVQHAVLGSIGRASCLTGVPEPRPTFPAGAPNPTPPALEMGLHDDFFNQIPFGLYWAGSLTMPLPPDLLAGVDLSSYGITDLQVSLDFWLPPILSACNDEARLMLQMGDIGVHVQMRLFGSPVDMQLFATMEAEASLTTVDTPTGKEIAIAVQQPSFLDVEIASLSGGLVGAEDVLGNLIRNVLLPQLLASLTGQTLGSFPLPEFDLSGLMPGLPPDTKIAIEIREVLRRHAYNIVSGNVGHP